VTYKVRLTRQAQDDLERLFDFILEREINRPGGGDLALADEALEAIHAGIQTLTSSPFTCRKAGSSPFLRELIISFGRSGYVALFEVDNATTVTVLAVRHQLEDDYH
jgi:plasmid stabilization system protein ParE